MTSSFNTVLGSQRDAPPDISKWNYTNTEPDLVKSVNSEIDETTKAMNDYFKIVIDQENQYHKNKQSNSWTWNSTCETRIDGVRVTDSQCYVSPADPAKQQALAQRTAAKSAYDTRVTQKASAEAEAKASEKAWYDQMMADYKATFTDKPPVGGYSAGGSGGSGLVLIAYPE